MAYQTADVARAMEADSSVALAELRVDGGGATNDLTMQFQADMLDVDVVRPRITETTALGAAYLAGLATGVWENTDDVAAHWHEQRRFKPKAEPKERERLLHMWHRAVERSTRWEEPDA
jgi:glycerol kinase